MKLKQWTGTTVDEVLKMCSWELFGRWYSVAPAFNGFLV